MPPADAPDARPHERALAEDLTGASLLRTRNVDNTEKRVEKAETRSETRSAAARPWSAPDAREAARVSAKHASTRRPGAILRAAERLVLAAAVEDAAASDAITQGDGSLDQPTGGSDDTRLEAGFREPDVFDALFLREKETDGETNLPWWSKMVPVDLPSESAVDLDLANVSACIADVSKEDETFDRDVAAPPSADTYRDESRPDAKAESREKKKAAALAASETNEDTNDPSMLLDADLVRALARLRVAVDGAKAKARAARERLTRNLINEDARVSAALRSVGVDPWLAEEALATRADARTAQARATFDARRRAYHARCDAPDSGGSPLNPASAAGADSNVRDQKETCEPGSALVKFNAQSRRTQPLRDFLVAHFDHPYPSDAQRERLARASGMSRAQVGNWFINARVRIWRPMILRLGEQIEDERRADRARSARGGRVNGSQTIKTNTVSTRNARNGDRTMA